MNNFKSLYEGVMRIERGYDADDQGSPAYCGINKRYHPSWEGWKLLANKPLKQGAFYPDLEPYVIKFYTEFWKPVRVDEINALPLAQLLVDMRTQHGSWARIVNAAQTGKTPFDIAVPNTLTNTNIAWINNDTARAYKAIADTRLKYVKGIKLANEADRQGIINRANHYVNLAAAFVARNPKTLLTILLIVGLFIYAQNR